MPERVVRPSLKLVIASYVFVFLILCAAAWFAYGYRTDVAFNPWHLLALVLFYFPLKAHLRARLNKLIIDTDHVTYETGFLSRARRTLDMARVQDVTVTQTFVERMLGIGDLKLETAGESSGVIIHAIDNPRATEDMILSRARELIRLRAQSSGI